MTKIPPAARAVILLLSFSFSLNAQPPVISFQNQSLAGVNNPVDIVSAGDGSGRMFIVQQNGLIKTWDRNTSVTPPNFLDLGPSGENLITTAGSEEGLLSMAFHPDYDGVTNRYFFVYYTDLASNLAIRRYETAAGNPNTVDLASDLLILTISHPGQTNHNGGKLNFGPDGYLYLATGDGGGSNDPDDNAQDGSSLLGKMLRIDINNTSLAYGNYSVPPDNPHTAPGDPIDDRIWARGLRNPFRWSFDRLNGNMWIGDVGQGAREEVNFRAAGAPGGVNYGWDCYEGYIRTPGQPVCNPDDYIQPVYDYNNPTPGASAITGGYVYRGTEYPAFRGYYLAADVYSGNIYILWPNGSGGFDSSVQSAVQTFIFGFGEAEDGTLYAVGGAGVFKVEATGGTVLPVRLGSFAVRRVNGVNELKWTTSFEENTARFHIEWSANGLGFTRAAAVNASRNTGGGSYTYLHMPNTQGSLYYRLAIEDDDGSIRYSSILQLVGDKEKAKIYPTIVRDRTLSLSLPQPASLFQLVGGNGALVYERSLANATGAVTISLPSLPKGLYIARVVLKDEVRQEKILVE